jgi:hypothetical protein
MAWNTSYDLEALMVPTKAAAVYTAQENSLYITGGLVPMTQIAGGSYSAQIPVFAGVTAEELTSGAHDAEDFTALGVSATKVTIEANIIAARDVIRDLGGVNPADLGRVLGNAVAAKFDANVSAVLADAGITGTLTTGGSVDTDALFDAAAVIRGNGEMGALVAVLSPAAAAGLMKAIGSASYAGSDLQNSAMANAYVGSVGGIRVFQSAYMTAQDGCVFGADAARIAMFANVNVEAQRRAAAVGADVVASLHAGVGLIDGSRAVRLLTA